MKPEEIKAEYDSMCKAIETAYNRIDELQSICKHENKTNGVYSWRAGSYQDAVICDHCGKVITIIQPFDLGVITTTKK